MEGCGRPRRRRTTTHDATHRALRAGGGFRRCLRRSSSSLGLAGLAEARPASLSLGQRQRVALARTIATPTTVALLDEPLAAIDDAGRQAIRDLLPTIGARYVLWVTHDPADATMATQHVSVIAGRVRQTLQA